MQPDTDCEMQSVKQHSAARKHNLRAQQLRLYKTVHTQAIDTFNIFRDSPEDSPIGIGDSPK